MEEEAVNESKGTLADRTMEAALLEAISPLRTRADAAIETFAKDWDQAPAPLGEAMRYAVTAGGKRLRPILVFAAYDAAGGSVPTTPGPFAAALEMIHAYSLAHDDLPSMDNDVERRGRPTLHIAYDEATAVLVGDALLTEAFSVATHCEASPTSIVRAVRALSQAAGPNGMVGGQVLDILEPEPVYEDLRRMHALKTGALFRCACQLGALGADADGTIEATLLQFGEVLGEAFQISDDLVDFLDIDDAGEHEKKVNMAAILGPAGVADKVESDCDAASGLLSELPGEVQPLVSLVEWVRQRSRDAMARIAE
ncbi:MAG: geranylgeranyl pyrophosphate synthase [Bradymonadia bacterium]